MDAAGLVARSHLGAIAVLIFLCLACYLPGIASIAPIDRDEARFIQATKQMLESGDFINIRMHDEPRYKKPVGIYWLQAATVLLVGQDAGAPVATYRLVSVAGATMATLLVYWLVLPMFGRAAAVVGAAAFAMSFLVTMEAHIARTDAVLVATVVLAQGALARIYLWTGSGRPPLVLALMFWIAVGVGILIKGPIIVMVSGLTVAALVAVDRQVGWLRGLRPAIGVPLLLAIVLPWFVAILAIGGFDFLQASLVTDFLGKVATGQEGHGAPPGVHFVAFWVLFWPAVPLAVVAAPWVWRNRQSPAVRFCLAWIVPSWIVLEAVATKLPHYPLPLYPAIAALSGGAAAAAEPLRRWGHWATAWAAVVGIGLPLAAIAGLALIEGRVSIVGATVAVGVAGLAAMALRQARRGSALAATALVMAAALLIYPLIYGAVLPQIDAIRVAPRLAAASARATSCLHPAVVAAGYMEPSLIFAVGTDITLADGERSADFLKGGDCRVALIESRQDQIFNDEAVSLGLSVERVETVDGINLGRIERVSVAVYRVKSGGS
ncbi:MAG: glycosyltransferase family 39 protein [Bauldia sp.]